jgi:hypothetical protein
MQPAVLLEVSKLLEDKISLSAWKGTGWYSCNSTLSSCWNILCRLGPYPKGTFDTTELPKEWNSYWKHLLGTGSVGRDVGVVFIFESDFPDRTK